MAGYIGSGASVVSSGVENKKVFDITTNTTSLTGLNYTVGKVHVYHNGVRLVDGTDFTATNSTSIALTVAAVSGDQVVVVSFASYQVALSGIDDQSNAVAMTIDSNENIGIGTSSPYDKLHVDGASAFIRVNRTDGEAGITLMYNGSNSTRSNIATQTNGDLNFETANTERMRIDSSGNVGIGTDDPTHPLHLKTPGGTVILLESTSGNTQTAKISFDQSYHNTLDLSTQYQSSTNTSKIKISPATQTAVVFRGGTSTTSAGGSLRNYGYTTNSGFYGPKWGTWTESMQTFHGGQQTVRIIEDHTGRWIVVGRWDGNAASSIQGTWSSVSGLSTSLDQNNQTAFSSDFGSTYPTECRFLGSTDWSNYYNTRTIDFIHGIPVGRPWELFMSNGATTGMGQVTGSAGGSKYGWTARGAYDGFGRWSNPNYLYHKIGDVGTAMTHSSNAFRTPTSNAFNWNHHQDAKVTVNGTGLDHSGQDVTASSGFGRDDANGSFYDEYPALIGNFASNNGAGGGTINHVFSSPVWVLIKMSGI